MVQKIIFNPKTGKFLQIRQRTTSEGRKGQIMGGYSSETAKIINHRFGKAIKKLSSK